MNALKALKFKFFREYTYRHKYFTTRTLVAGFNDKYKQKIINGYPFASLITLFKEHNLIKKYTKKTYESLIFHNNNEIIASKLLTIKKIYLASKKPVPIIKRKPKSAPVIKKKSQPKSPNALVEALQFIDKQLKDLAVNVSPRKAVDIESFVNLQNFFEKGKKNDQINQISNSFF